VTDPAAVFERIVRGRRMTRAFRPDPLDPALVDGLVDLARRAPSAGNTAGLRFLVLDGPDDVATYWETTLPADRRARFPWPGLLRAPVLVVPCVSPAAYVARYAEPDKAARRAASAAERAALGAEAAAWPVPYWFVDGGMAAMTLLLAAEATGLGALFFGIFEHEGELCRRFAVAAGWRPIGTVALGWADDAPPSRSSSVPASVPVPVPVREPGSVAGLSGSARRGRPPLGEVLHRGRWPAG
jgi:nitroreductase